MRLRRHDCSNLRRSIRRFSRRGVVPSARADQQPDALAPADLHKAGCSPPVVRLYRKCDTWRKNTEAQPAALHPAIVFVSWARWLEAKAKPERGVPTGLGSPWEDGVAAIFQFLAHASGRVIFISDVPTLPFSAARCVASHLTGVQPCNDTPRTTAIVLPQVKAEELRLARACTSQRSIRSHGSARQKCAPCSSTITWSTTTTPI